MHIEWQGTVSSQGKLQKEVSSPRTDTPLFQNLIQVYSNKMAWYWQRTNITINEM